MTFISLGAQERFEEELTKRESDIMKISTMTISRNTHGLQNETNISLERKHVNSRRLFLAEPSPSESFSKLREVVLWYRALRLSWPHACSPSEDIPEGPYLVILVHSHVLNSARRDAVRETWGRITRDYDNPHHVTLYFLLGLPEKRDDMAPVDKEARLYRDILQWNFIDSYKNLSVKSLLGMQWVSKHCQNAKFIMKADDDVYLNITHILQFITDVSRQDTFNSSNYLVGHINRKSPVLRIGQWGVSISNYPLNTYPPYCSGAAYVMALPTAQQLCKEFATRSELTILPVEDVFITGIMAALAGFRCRHDNHFPGWMTLVSIDGVQDLLRGDLFGLHGVSDIKMRLLGKITRQCRTCLTNQDDIEAYLSEDTEYEIYFDNIDEGFTDLWSFLLNIIKSAFWFGQL